MNFRKNPYLTACLASPLFFLLGWGLALWSGHRGDPALAAAGILAFLMCLAMSRGADWSIDLPKGFSIHRVIYGAGKGVWLAAFLCVFDLLDGMARPELTVKWLFVFVVFGTIQGVFARPATPEVAALYEGPNALDPSKGWRRVWAMAYPVLAPAFCVFILMTNNDVLLTAIMIVVPISWLPTFKERRDQPQKHSAEWYAKYGLTLMAGLLMGWMFGLDL
ncbi:hypothetical protein [Donghicola mangrovi]|uniref:Uncharacterized protein n=1 Tax=Donghicola mangrovi TaxID=2729614 RepID=A0A850Q348_9RHOB|nr:hypothetical protein [Donghicola mangrovi]NVO22412.1 hypothetical protein [Donghicola mangrovi]